MRRGAPLRRPAPPAAPSGNGPRREGPIQLEVRAWASVLAVQKRALAVIRRDLEREMTLPRFDLLGALCNTDNQTLSSLARVLQVTAANLTGLVDRAVRDGLVERRADPGDRRAWRVHVTAKGQRAYAEAERHHAVRVKKLFEGLTPAELATLIHLLDKLHRTLGARALEVLSRQATVGSRTRALAGLTKPRRARPKRES